MPNYIYYQIYDTSNQACPILSRNTLVAVPTDESDFTARLDTSRMRYPDNVSEIMTAIANNEDLQESYEAFRGRISVDRYSPPLPANGRIPWGVGSTVQAPLIFDIGGDITRERNSKGSVLAGTTSKPAPAVPCESKPPPPPYSASQFDLSGTWIIRTDKSPMDDLKHNFTITDTFTFTPSSNPSDNPVRTYTGTGARIATPTPLGKALNMPGKTRTKTISNCEVTGDRVSFQWQTEGEILENVFVGTFEQGGKSTLSGSYRTFSTLPSVRTGSGTFDLVLDKM